MFSDLCLKADAAFRFLIFSWYKISSGRVSIITDPPYALAREFIERALHFGTTRIVAMLLRTDFGHAA
jgi:hypothetical protein